MAKMKKKKKKHRISQHQIGILCGQLLPALGLRNCPVVVLDKIEAAAFEDFSANFEGLSLAKNGGHGVHLQRFRLGLLAETHQTNFLKTPSKLLYLEGHLEQTKVQQDLLLAHRASVDEAEQLLESLRLDFHLKCNSSSISGQELLCLLQGGHQPGSSHLEDGAVNGELLKLLLFLLFIFGNGQKNVSSRGF
ncbi:hypothetical protein TYRP_015071 [Tyrophagus putrescentiae]|nr:hypothetical protein TYRP_015071 [Tyrophagus putrescentiae]